MTPRPHKKRVSKADWLAAALEELERGGVDAVRIEQLARKLGVAKSGFYWHFQDRPDLLREMMRFWEHEYTGVVADNPEVTALEPKRRLLTTAEMILDHELTRYDLAMRAWAAHDKSAAGAVAEVYRTTPEGRSGNWASQGRSSTCELASTCATTHGSGPRSGHRTKPAHAAASSGASSC
jgi:AcrR family transcriptional regulator